MANLNKRPKDKNALPHGEWIDYYENGKLSSRSNWIHGTRHGFCEGYKDDGTLLYRGYNKMGREVGYWYYYGEKHYLLCLI